jgi:uncharacterized membrane protein YraQ (UPF0718 family)
VLEASGVESGSGRRAALVGLAACAAIAVATLWWAKWWPYGHRIAGLRETRAWSGSSIMRAGGVRAGDAPSWAAAWSFTRTYLWAIWKALVAALLISAAVQAFLPRAWLLKVLNRPGRLRAAAVGGLVSTPSMMCACCSAPVAATLRREGVQLSAAVAYWLGNPLLNPAVLVFLLLVAPWEWTVTRLVVGILVVVGGAALVARWSDRPLPPDAMADLPRAQPDAPGGPAVRFVRALVRLVVTLLPEYVLVVLLIGALRGWLFQFGSGGWSSGPLVVLAAAVLGTLLVIPTAGEIPILTGLALAGLSGGPIGALLVTLPAVSLPGIALIGRSLGWRATALTASVVASGGVVAACLLTAL